MTAVTNKHGVHGEMCAIRIVRIAEKRCHKHAKVDVHIQLELFKMRR